MTKEELLKMSAGELTDPGICPTCFNRAIGKQVVAFAKVGGGMRSSA